MIETSGWLVVNADAYINYALIDGKFVSTHTDTKPTGWFWFKYRDGTRTQSYTIQTAPEWLLKLYQSQQEKNHANG